MDHRFSVAIDHCHRHLCYSVIFRPIDLEETIYIYIDEKKRYEEVVLQLKEKDALSSEKLFDMLAQRMNYPNSVKTGRYAIEEGMTMPDVIRLLRSGNQTPVNLTFNNIRSKENLAGRISQQLMLDSLSLLNLLNEPSKAKELGLNEQTILSIFIPNTYEVYWDTGTDNLLKRMKKEYDVFWNENRKSKAEKIGLRHCRYQYWLQSLRRKRHMPMNTLLWLDST